jgi:FAS-associated factor 2
MSLTDEQQQLVATFHEITQLEDEELIVQILRQNNWDVDQAVNNYVAGSSDPTPVSTSSSTSIDQQVWRNTGDSGGSDNRQQLESNQNWLINALFNPLKVVFFARPAILNPEADTRRFINDFNAKYGYQHPAFQVSSYQASVVQAFRQHKMLLVYIHSPLHEDTSAFCENALCSQNITRYIDENTVFWSGSVWDPEAYSLSTQLKASTFPFLALLVCQSERVVQVIDRIQGITEEEPFLERLTSVVGLANPVATRIRTDVQRR